jgi:hypothetical protein
VRIVCDGGGCNGLPCEIDPGKNDIGVVTSNLAATGAGDARFCVATVPRGAKARIEVFDTAGRGPAAPQPSGSAAPSSSGQPGASGTGSGAGPSRYAQPTVAPGIFPENGTTMVPTATGSNAATAPTNSQTGDGVARQKGSAAIAGLVVALVAAACFY